MHIPCDPTTACPYCGEPEEIELLEAYADGTFMLSTCCEGMHEATVHFLQEHPSEALGFMRALNTEALVGFKLRSIAQTDCAWLLDATPDLRPISFSQVRSFMRHHRHNQRLTGWKFGAGIWNGHQLIGVVSVGRPVARALDHTAVLEVNRLCIDPGVPRELAWNACSTAYGWAARAAGRMGYRLIVTYTRADEDGTSLIASGWTRAAEVRARRNGFASQHRARAPAESIAKVRWERVLKPARRPVASPWVSHTPAGDAAAPTRRAVNPGAWSPMSLPAATQPLAHAGRPGTLLSRS